MILIHEHSHCRSTNPSVNFTCTVESITLKAFFTCAVEAAIGVRADGIGMAWICLQFTLICIYNYYDTENSCIGITFFMKLNITVAYFYS